jgi:hypothetical protein
MSNEVRWAAIVLACAFAAGCGDDDAGDDADAGYVCDFPLQFEVGGTGHADPLGAGPNEARAGRVTADDLPEVASGLAVWEPGDYVLANDRIAMVIEDVGQSQLYDPWGGRPVGLALVEDGAMVMPADFGEFFVLTNREGIVTQSVSVINDGSNGEPAVVRAAGFPSPIPFYEAIVGGLFRETHRDIPTAIDYVLEPGADYVDIVVTHHSPRRVDAELFTVLHGFMYTPRMPPFAPGVGFETEGETVAYRAFIDEGGASYAYSRLDGPLTPGVSASGFTSNFGGSFTIAACGETVRHHARIAVGGPDVDGLVQAVARANGDALREITGTVRDAAGAPAAGVRVHAESDTGEYLTRARSAADGSYAVHVPAGTAVTVTAYRVGDNVIGPLAVAATEATRDIDLDPTGAIHVTAVDAVGGGALPVRVQVLPNGQGVPSVPSRFGEAAITGGRLHVEYPVDGDVTMRAPAGDWEVVVSRGYEYEIYREDVSVTAGATAEVAASLERVVDTTGVQCADFHIHTRRSADSGDPSLLKLQSAVADGLELPVRSEHEYANDFSAEIAELGVEQWAYAVPSVEMTTMELYGHFGVLPIQPDESAINGDTPLWQEFPTVDNPDVELRSLPAPELFARVRARPEEPVIIINHPRGGQNYFEYTGYDPVTGMPDYPEFWDDQFPLVEVFNDSSWRESLDRTVVDWLSLLDNGRRVFAVGSSDSHGISRSPVGYPRTCLEVGTDDPAALSWNQVRDVTAAGHSTISGGVYVDANVGSAGPGDDATGLGATASVHVRVQAASWVDVDAIDVVVDGMLVATIAIDAGDADPGNPVIRWEGDIDVDVAAGMGSYVIVAAYGDSTLEPVHPGRIPFGATNPIFLAR